jgi:hypothetical protein
VEAPLILESEKAIADPLVARPEEDFLSMGGLRAIRNSNPVQICNQSASPFPCLYLAALVTVAVFVQFFRIAPVAAGTLAAPILALLKGLMQPVPAWDLFI